MIQTGHLQVPVWISDETVAVLVKVIEHVLLVKFDGFSDKGRLASDAKCR